MATNVHNETAGEPLPTPQTICAVLLRATIDANNFHHTKVDQDPFGHITVLSKHPEGLAFALDAFLQSAETISIGNGRSFSKVASAEAQDLVTLLQFRRQANESLHGQKRQSIGVQLYDEEALKLATILAEKFEETLNVTPDKANFPVALKTFLEVVGRPSKVNVLAIPPGASVQDSGPPSADHAFIKKVVCELDIDEIDFLRDGKNSVICAKSLFSSECALSNASLKIARSIREEITLLPFYRRPQQTNTKKTGVHFNFCG